LTCLQNFVEVDYTEQSITVSSSTLGPLDPFNLYQLPLEHHSQQIHVRKEEPLRRELEDFLAAVRDKRPPLVTGEDAPETLRLAGRARSCSRVPIARTDRGSPHPRRDVAAPGQSPSPACSVRPPCSRGTRSRARPRGLP